MTELQFVYLLAFVFLLAPVLLTTGARSALEHANNSRLLGQSDARENSSNPAFPSLKAVYYTRAGLFWISVISHFALGALALAFFMPWFDELVYSLLSIIGILAVAFIVARLEWKVREQTAIKAEEWAFKLAYYSKVITAALYPLLVLTVPYKPKLNGFEPGLGAVTEDELKSIVAAGEQEGLLEQEERKMIYSIFRLGDTLAREIMIPRIDTMALDVQTPLTQAVDELLKSGFSRVPVYEETVDNVLGVLYTKDLLRVWREGSEITSLRSLLRPAYFVPEAKKVDELLAEMQARRVHLAVVVDEYGGVAGVVTLEDIVEEIVGEIQDEYDQAEESPYQQIEKGKYIFQGRVDLDDFNEIMGSNLPNDEADTIGGFIYNRVGRVPNTSESIQVDNLLLTVEQVSGRRIRKVRAAWVPIEVEEKKEETNVDH